jgi:dTDP-4-amino-4,6-dideoxygalactose transaminase
MLNTPFAPWPSFTSKEADAVHRVVISNKVNYWTGSECRDFEREFALWTGSRYAVSLANGTLALEAALRALKIGPGDEVIVTPRSFIASASCVVTVGATPVFSDVEKCNGNISIHSIRELLTPRTKAIICVHLAGWPCDMNPIMELADVYGLKVIEDCAQAHGATYQGRSVGTIGHVGAWSFCQDKIMSTGGEGGMVTTNDETLWRTMWAYKDHGKSHEAVYEREHPSGFRWLHESFGTNWRMLETQAAIGRIQLQYMNEWSKTRARNAAAIWDTCRKFSSLRVPEFKCQSCDGGCEVSDRNQGCVHAHYKCYVYIRPDNLGKGWTRDRIIEEINGMGVPCYQGSCSEVYLEKAFDNTGWRPKERLPVAKELGETSLMFLVHPTLTAEEIGRTCNAIEKVMSKASK